MKIYVEKAEASYRTYGEKEVVTIIPTLHQQDSQYASAPKINDRQELQLKCDNSQEVRT